jgi:hypothetical protein
MFAPNQSYQTKEQCTSVVIDVRILCVAERFYRERTVWGELVDVEAQDQQPYVLMVSRGEAARRQAK